MQNDNIDISVIVPTYNRAAKLPSVLEAWKDASERTNCTYELLFSDDGSEDDTISILKSCTSLPIKVIENDHGGASSARNNAIKYASGDRIIFVGDDIYPDPHFIQKHFNYGREYGDSVAILGEVDWHPDQRRSYLLKHITEVGNEQFSFNRLKPDSYTDFRHFYTCNISLSKKMLDSVDTKFDERFYKVNFEDTELSYRLCANGMKIIYKPDTFGYHYHEYTTEGFCKRQSTAGEMSVVFQNLHPELDSILGISKVCESFEKFKSERGDKEEVSNTISVPNVVGVCNGLESRLQESIDDGYELYIKRVLSILYERLFRLKYFEGILRIRYPDDVVMIEEFLAARHIDGSLRDALLAEYYSGMDMNSSVVAHLFNTMVLRKHPVDPVFHTTMNEILNGVFDDDIDDSSVYRVNRQLILNRVKAELKKYYLLRQLKYRYDSLRRNLFLRSH